MSPRATSLFACQSCGASSPKWLGRCPECGEWNSYVEEAPAPAPSAVERVRGQAEGRAPAAVVVDSIQAVRLSALSSGAGTVSQVRESAARFVRYAKERSVPVLLVGHVTKDGSLAGPKVLEHLVDAVISIDGDRG